MPSLPTLRVRFCRLISSRASKGIETSSLGFMADILRDCLGKERSYAFLSGPSFAREILEGVATAVVIASEDLMLADDLAELMAGEDFAV